MDRLVLLRGGRSDWQPLHGCSLTDSQRAVSSISIQIKVSDGAVSGLFTSVITAELQCGQ